MKTLKNQVGGDHYQNMVVQPLEYISKNKMGFLEGNVIKYISRYKSKNGIEDLEKAKQNIDIIIECIRKKEREDLDREAGIKIPDFLTQVIDYKAELQVMDGEDPWVVVGDLRKMPKMRLYMDPKTKTTVDYKSDSGWSIAGMRVEEKDWVPEGFFVIQGKDRMIYFKV